jgi:hypothetical protein
MLRFGCKRRLVLVILRTRSKVGQNAESEWTSVSSRLGDEYEHEGHGSVGTASTADELVVGVDHVPSDSDDKNSTCNCKGSSSSESCIFGWFRKNRLFSRHIHKHASRYLHLSLSPSMSHLANVQILCSYTSVRKSCRQNTFFKNLFPKVTPNLCQKHNSFLLIARFSFLFPRTVNHIFSLICRQ